MRVRAQQGPASCSLKDWEPSPIAQQAGRDLAAPAPSTGPVQRSRPEATSPGKSESTQQSSDSSGVLPVQCVGRHTPPEAGCNSSRARKELQLPEPHLKWASGPLGEPQLRLCRAMRSLKSSAGNAEEVKRDKTQQPFFLQPQPAKTDVSACEMFCDLPECLISSPNFPKSSEQK